MPVSERQHRAEHRTVDAMRMLTAYAVTLAVRMVECDAGITDRRADPQVSVPVAVPTGARDNTALRALHRRPTCDEVDYATDRLRTVHDLARAFQHLDALQRFDGRRVVHRRVTIRPEQDRHAILEQQRARGTPGRQAAESDVEVQPVWILVGSLHTRNRTQRIHHGERRALVQDLL